MPPVIEPPRLLALLQEAVKKGAPDDGAFETDRLERVEVVPRTDAAGCQHGTTERVGDALQEIEIGPGEGSVTVDGRAEETRNACRTAAIDRFVDREPAAPFPAVGAHLPAAHINRDHEPFAERFDKATEVAFESRGADDHAGNPGGDEGQCVRRSAHPSAKLQRNWSDRLRQRTSELQRRATVPRGVEHDNVQERRHGSRKAAREVDGIAGLASDFFEVTALETHGAPVEHVDRGQQLQRLR